MIFSASRNQIDSHGSIFGLDDKAVVVEFVDTQTFLNGALHIIQHPLHTRIYKGIEGFCLIVAGVVEQLVKGDESHLSRQGHFFLRRIGLKGFIDGGKCHACLILNVIVRVTPEDEVLLIGVLLRLLGSGGFGAQDNKHGECRKPGSILGNRKRRLHTQIGF